MLYDKRWDVKTDPFSLICLIEWLEVQPADGTYDYTCPFGCLLQQYFVASGFKKVVVLPTKLLHSGAPIDLPPTLIRIARAAASSDWTFGAALKRARALAKQS